MINFRGRFFLNQNSNILVFGSKILRLDWMKKICQLGLSLVFLLRRIKEEARLWRPRTSSTASFLLFWRGWGYKVKRTIKKWIHSIIHQKPHKKSWKSNLKNFEIFLSIFMLFRPFDYSFREKKPRENEMGLHYFFSRENRRKLFGWKIAQKCNWQRCTLPVATNWVQISNKIATRLKTETIFSVKLQMSKSSEKTNV